MSKKKQNTQSKDQQQQYLLIGGVVGVAVLIFIGAIVLGSLNTGVTRGEIDYSSITTVEEDGVYVLGNPNAPVTVVEFADFLCPYCQDYKSTIDQVIEELVMDGQARLEFRAYPVINQDSVYYAQLLECAGTLGGPVAFWRAHEELFYQANNNASGDDAGRTMAQDLDLDYADLLECTADAEQHQENLALGQQSNVQGTPAVRVRYGDSPRLEPIGSFERAGVPFSEIETLVQAANSTTMLDN
jgi:protein-disulfide isomerase